MKFRSLSLAFLVLFAGSGSVTFAATADELLVSFQRWLDGTDDLRGVFEQELISGALGTGIEESGDWFIRRPGQLRFDYHSPETKVAVINGADTLLWVQEDEHTALGEIDAESDLLVALLTGDRPLAELFLASIDVEPVRKGQARLRLVPRADHEALTELILTVPTSGNGLDAIEYLDPVGNRMLYRFARMKRNTGVSAELFQFVPPDGSLPR